MLALNPGLNWALNGSRDGTLRPNEATSNNPYRWQKSEREGTANQHTVFRSFFLT